MQMAAMCGLTAKTAWTRNFAASGSSGPGSYTSGSSFAEFAEAAEGVRRVGILRADVDSLGQAFASGFKNPDNKDRYVTLSRTAALSWQLSLFFKFYINRILEHGTYSMKPGRTPEPRRAAVVYSGGDDLFAAGAWNEVLELAVDIPPGI